jgi:hypothetical protein
MKGGKRQSDVDGGKVPFEVVGPKGKLWLPTPQDARVCLLTCLACELQLCAGIRAMIEGVFAHSQSFLNFPIVYTELDEGQPHDLGVKDGTVRPILAVCPPSSMIGTPQTDPLHNVRRMACVGLPADPSSSMLRLRIQGTTLPLVKLWFKTCGECLPLKVLISEARTIAGTSGKGYVRRPDCHLDRSEGTTDRAAGQGRERHPRRRPRHFARGLPRTLLSLLPPLP